MDKEALKRAMLKAQNMQLDLVRAQDELAHTLIEAQSKDGKIKITVSAQGDYRKVEIDPSTLVEGIHCVEKGVLEALNEASQKSAEITKAKLGAISGQIGL